MFGQEMQDKTLFVYNSPKKVLPPLEKKPEKCYDSMLKKYYPEDFP